MFTRKPLRGEPTTFSHLAQHQSTPKFISSDVKIHSISLQSLANSIAIHRARNQEVKKTPGDLLVLVKRKHAFSVYSIAQHPVQHLSP
jgi:PIN domain nuclease of toxin-antitoxin system